MTTARSARSPREIVAFLSREAERARANARYRNTGARAYTPEQRATALRAVLDGKTHEEAAALIGAPTPTIATWCQRAGIKQGAVVRGRGKRQEALGDDDWTPKPWRHPYARSVR